MMVAVLSFCLLLFFTLLPGGDTSNSCSCKYALQPPTMLVCDPLGTDITLWCESASNITWYWTQNVSKAGVTGTAILPGDNVHNMFMQLSSKIGIGFNVTESTLGYYWCEINNAVNVSLRPSTITHVCPPMSSSQQQKCNRSVINQQHLTCECAEVDSPTMFSRPPLPTSCAVSVPSATVMVHPTGTTQLFPLSTGDATITPSVDITVTTVTTTSVPPTVDTAKQSFLIPVVITVGVLVVVLVVVVVIIIIVVMCVLKKRKTIAMKGGEYRSRNGTPQPSLEQENPCYFLQLPQEKKKTQPQPTNGAENFNACLDQESQKITHVYAQLDPCLTPKQP